MLSETSTTLLDSLRNPRDGAAWRRFQNRYAPMLLSCTRRVGLSDADARDAVADTLATFVRRYLAGDFDRDKGRLRGWLKGILRHKVLKCLGRRSHVSLDAHRADGTRDIPEPVAPDDIDEAFERDWRLERLNQALHVLRRECDPDTYQAFDLYALKGWRVDKVAKFLGKSRNAVFISKARCLKKLRAIVEALVAQED